MSSRGDGTGTPDDAPDDMDTVVDPAASEAPEVPEDPSAATPQPAPGVSSTSGTSRTSDTSGASDPDPQSEETASPPEFIDRVPFGRPAVPDQAPIQRFDQRPRFEAPTEGAPPTAPFSDPPVPAAPHAPAGPPAPSRQSAPSSQPASAGPSPSALPPGIDATRPPRRRGLLLPAVAFGCAMLLLLGIGGGLTALWLTGPRDQPEPVADTGTTESGSNADPGTWHPLEAGQSPAGSAEELEQVLAENPLLQARLPVPGNCQLPATDDGAVPAEELTAYLEAGTECLASAWTDALEPVGIDFEAPDVAVFTTEDLPADAACEPGRFSDFAPVVCHDDNTLYWPALWDPGFSHASAEEAPQLYMWHLSYSYTLFALSAASLDGYYGALQLALAEDPERADTAQRRWALQISCLSSAATFQMPQGVRPDGRVEDFVTSVEAQAAPATAGEPASESRAAWVQAGLDSRGLLGECNTWTAPADAVA